MPMEILDRTFGSVITPPSAGEVVPPPVAVVENVAVSAISTSTAFLRADAVAARACGSGLGSGIDGKVRAPCLVSGRVSAILHRAQLFHVGGDLHVYNLDTGLYFPLPELALIARRDP